MPNLAVKNTSTLSKSQEHAYSQKKTWRNTLNTVSSATDTSGDETDETIIDSGT